MVLESSLSFRYDANTSVEGNYKLNESREHLYRCDFSSLTTEGRYYVSLDGAGRTYTFRIAEDVFERVRTRPLQCETCTSGPHRPG